MQQLAGNPGGCISQRARLSCNFRKEKKNVSSGCAPLLDKILPLHEDCSKSTDSHFNHQWSYSIITTNHPHNKQEHTTTPLLADSNLANTPIVSHETKEYRILHSIRSKFFDLWFNVLKLSKERFDFRSKSKRLNWSFRINNSKHIHTHQVV